MVWSKLLLGLLISARSSFLLLIDVLGNALPVSNNAIYILSHGPDRRQQHIVGGRAAAVVCFVENILKSASFDLSMLKVADVCGLSVGWQHDFVRVISDMLLSDTNKPFVESNIATAYWRLQ